MDELVTIGTFSMLTGLTVVALRHYDEVGVLKPADVDAKTGYRRYSRRQLDDGWLIADLRRIDLPLDDVRRAIELTPEERRVLLEAHRGTLRGRGRDVNEMLAHTDRLLATQEERVPTCEDVRLMAVNIGVESKEELVTAAAFWETALEAVLEDWNGEGLSRQARVGRESNAFFFNLRVRGEGEPHFGHRAAFGIAVADLDGFRERALAAGASEHYPPVDNEEQPRHFLISDPIGNRVVVWQG